MTIEKLIKKKTCALLIASILAFFPGMSCRKIEKLTPPEIKYKEPMLFEFELSSCYDMGDFRCQEFVKFCKDIWNNQLKDDEKIKEHTWKKGDYLVFVYRHHYSTGIGRGDDELILFTATKPISKEKLIYSTVTIFKYQGHLDSEAERIAIYTFIDDYNPVKSWGEVKQMMLDYLNEYLTEYENDLCIRRIKAGIQRFGDRYINNYTYHSVFFQPPGDFGGAIIVNRKTSTLAFLGGTVWDGSGTRIFPF